MSYIFPDNPTLPDSTPQPTTDWSLLGSEATSNPYQQVASNYPNPVPLLPGSEATSNSNQQPIANYPIPVPPFPGLMRDIERIFDYTWQPSTIEACLRYPREYSLAHPKQYPITHRLHQTLMNLAVQKVNTGPDGLDFAKLSYGLRTDELAMIFVCRSCNVTPLEWWRAVYTPEFNTYLEHVWTNERPWWDDYERRYRQGEFRLDAGTYLRVGWAVRVVFKDKYDATVERCKKNGPSFSVPMICSVLTSQLRRRQTRVIMLGS